MFQTESPSEIDLDALGIYLLVSLFFVAVTLIEFAIILMLKRSIEKNSREKQVHSGLTPRPRHKVGTMNRFGNMEGNRHLGSDRDEGIKRDVIAADDYISRIDNVTFIVFLFSYCTFNAVYWAIYLTD